MVIEVNATPEWERKVMLPGTRHLQTPGLPGLAPQPFLCLVLGGAGRETQGR